ncbi:MAG TPA: hypothetical protein PKX00_22195 [Opitutaceae bacterium]|nr:hypothetical protein [Opitutaceae bacterium]
MSRGSLLGRVLGGGPLLVSVAVHALVVGLAGIYVVHETVVGKKSGFEAPPARESAPVPREVEHRLRVARQSGGAAAVSPVSMQRVLTTAASAFALPPLPEMASSGPSLFGGAAGGTSAGLGLGRGVGLATGLGGGALGGKGLVSLRFLGLTSPRVNKVVFVVDVSRDLMDIRKGGFKAFGVIRDEMMRLVAELPPSAQFGVVLFGGAAGDINVFAPQLTPATVAAKETFFAWIRPVNARPDRLGTHSAGAFTPWKERPQRGMNVDTTLLPPPWVKALHAALELKPETAFLVTGSATSALRPRSEARREILERRNDLTKERLKRQGIDPEGIARARLAALAKARRELQAINAQLQEQGKSPYIVTDTKRIFQPDFQAALKQAGFAIELDTTGWADAQGKPIWELGVSAHEKVDFAEVLTHIARLQNGLLREKAVLHPFLFVGPDEKPKDPVEHLTLLAQRNGGKFSLLTARTLEALAEKRP